jgi:hypothetical protein
MDCDFGVNTDTHFRQPIKKILHELAYGTAVPNVGVGHSGTCNYVPTFKTLGSTSIARPIVPYNSLTDDVAKDLLKREL